MAARCERKSRPAPLGAFDHLAITASDWGGPMFVSTLDLDLTQARELFNGTFLARGVQTRGGAHKSIP